MRKIVLLLFCASAAQGLESRVAIILQQDLADIAQEDIAFYEEVQKDIAMQTKWHIQNGLELNKALGSDLTAINTTSAPKGDPSEQDLVPNIQKALDTMAIDAAVLVHCRKTSGLYRGCGLYYYDRSSSKVVASAEKFYGVPIEHVTRWSPRLVASLNKGLSRQKRLDEENAMARLAQRSQTDSDKPKIEIGAGFSGQQASLKGAKISTSTQFHGYAGATWSNASIGIEAGYGKVRAASESYRHQEVAAVFGSRSKAMTNLQWELSILAGLARRSLRSTSGDLQATQPFLGAKPGISWLFSNNWDLGIDLRYVQYFAGKTTATEEYRNQHLNDSAWGSNFHIRYRF